MTTKKKPASAPPAKTNTATVDAHKGETNLKAIARIASSPTFNAAVIKHQIIGGMVRGAAITVSDVAGVVMEQTERVTRDNDMSGVEAMLLAQAGTCDMLFNDMVLKARASDTMPVLEAYMRMALKAQQQCASTLRILGELKTPKQIAFIKQANVAHGPQQVNNCTAPPTRAHEESSNKSNELLEHQHGERLDTGTAGQAGRGNQTLETVGTIDRAKD